MTVPADSSMEEQHSDEVSTGGSIPRPRTNPAERRRDLNRDRRFRWAELIGLPECPYLQRWVLQPRRDGMSLRVHHFMSSDDDKAFHDHPWWFVTLVLRGSYVDASPDGRDRLKVGSIRYRRAHHRHTVETEGVWTLVLTGRKRRTWGFWDRITGKFVKANKWFFTRGHHPCA